MHEMDLRIGEQAADERDFRNRSAVKMPHPAFPDRAQYRWFRIAFHGIEHVATECLHERTRRGHDYAWADAMQRLFRAQHSYDVGDGAFGLGADRKIALRRADGGTLLNPTHGTKSWSKNGGVTRFFKTIGLHEKLWILQKIPIHWIKYKAQKRDSWLALRRRSF